MKFNVGQKVFIHKNSEYYIGASHNPRDVVGEISEIDGYGDYPIWVDWGGNNVNCYREEDLVPLRERCEVIYHNGHMFIRSKSSGVIFSTIDNHSNISRNGELPPFSLFGDGELPPFSLFGDAIIITLPRYRKVYGDTVINFFLERIKSVTNSKGRVKYVDIEYDENEPYRVTKFGRITKMKRIELNLNQFKEVENEI